MSKLYSQTGAFVEVLYLSLLIFYAPSKVVFLLTGWNVYSNIFQQSGLMTAKESCKKDHQRLFLTFALHFYNLKKFQNKVSFCFKKPMLSSFKCIINCNNTRCGVSCTVCTSVFPGPHSTSEIQLWLRSSIHSHNQISAFFPQI